MRVTRARAQQGHDETADATERAPLNEITSNASTEQVHDEEEEPPAKTSAKTPAKTPAKKGKGKARAKKGKKAKAAEEDDEDEEQAAPEAIQVPTSTDHSKPESQALVQSQDATAAPTNSVVYSSVDASEDAEAPAKIERPVTPPPKAVRLTRRQLAMQEEEKRQAESAALTVEEPVAEAPDSTTDAAKTAEADQQVSEEIADAAVPETQNVNVQEEPVAEPETVAEEVQHEPIVESVDKRETSPDVSPVMPQVEEPQNQISEAAADVPAPSVEISSEAEPKTLVAEKPSEDIITPLRSQTSSRRASRSPSKSPMRLEESFEAIDALEEALENVTSVARIDRLDEETLPERTKVSKATGTAGVRPKSIHVAGTTTVRPKSMHVTGTTGARPKSIHGTTTTAVRVSKAPSAAAPTSMKSTKPPGARAPTARTAPTKEVKTAHAETVDYLASKRRPISMSFPTPAPPPKGRAPTRPTFQLSSDDVVAKLKAQKEERLKREAEGTAPKARPISMPPPPKSNKPLTKPTFQLPGERIAEKLKAQKEERLKREAEQPAPTQRPASMSMAPLAKSTKAPTKANFELPGSAVAEKLRLKKEERLKRMEEAEAAKKEALKPRPAPVRKPVSVPIRPAQQAPGVTIGPPPPPPQPQPQQQRSTSLASKRSSMSLSQPPSQSRSTSTSSANRSSIIVPKAVVTPEDAVLLKLKGKEVFNRDRVEKEARERERREKEEAAKRARAEAAERGRIASREWAEKQRRKMMAMANGGGA